MPIYRYKAKVKRSQDMLAPLDFTPAIKFAEENFKYKGEAVKLEQVTTDISQAQGGITVFTVNKIKIGDHSINGTPVLKIIQKTRMKEASPNVLNPQSREMITEFEYQFDLSPEQDRKLNPTTAITPSHQKAPAPAPVAPIEQPKVQKTPANPPVTAAPDKPSTSIWGALRNLIARGDEPKAPERKPSTPSTPTPPPPASAGSTPKQDDRIKNILNAPGRIVVQDAKKPLNIAGAQGPIVAKEASEPKRGTPKASVQDGKAVTGPTHKRSSSEDKVPSVKSPSQPTQSSTKPQMLPSAPASRPVSTSMSSATTPTSVPGESAPTSVSTPPLPTSESRASTSSSTPVSVPKTPTDFIPPPPFVMSSGAPSPTKTPPPLVNTKYQYYDTDMDAILAARLKEEKSRNTNFQKVYSLNAVGDFQPGRREAYADPEHQPLYAAQIKTWLSKPENYNNASGKLLVPLNQGNNHWVGLVVHFDAAGEITRLQYSNSLPDHNNTNVSKMFKIYDDLGLSGSETPPPENVALHTQKDFDSCGAYAIENLLLAAQLPPQQKSVEKLEPLDNVTVRQKQLQCLEDQNKDYYGTQEKPGFYERQLKNEPPESFTFKELTPEQKNQIDTLYAAISNCSMANRHELETALNRDLEPPQYLNAIREAIERCSKDPKDTKQMQAVYKAAYLREGRLLDVDLLQRVGAQLKANMQQTVHPPRPH